MVSNLVRAGLLASGQGTDSIQLVEFLNNINVFVNGRPWSYSQQGNFTSAVWNVLGQTITVIGPRGAGTLRKRFWNIHRRLIIFAFNGQSNDVGANTNQSGDSDPTVPFMQLAPIPNILKAYTGGFTPTQDGVGTPAVTTFILPEQYADIVPGHENINTGRVPGDEVNRQMWSSAFGQAIAAALDGDNIVLVINMGHGGTAFTDDVQGAAFLANATWHAGVATFTFQQNIRMPKGATFTVNSSGGFNGTFTARTSNNAAVVTVNMAGDPGVYPGGGFALVPQPPMVNLYNTIQYAVDVIGPAIGLTPYFAALGYNGNEANDTLAATANFVGEFTTLRGMMNDFEAICGQTERSLCMWAQVGYPVASWQQTDDSLFGCASNVALGALLESQTPANFCITWPQYSSPHAAAGPCIHYAIQGHSDNGERPANLFLDAVIGDADPTAVQLLTGENVLVRVANSTSVAGTYNRNVVIDTSSIAPTDPGNHGFQFYSGVANIAAADGGNGFEDAVSAVSVPGGTTFGLTTIGAPAHSWGNFVGYAYNNADEFTTPNNTQIKNFSWAATGGGQGTYGTVAPHGLSLGDTVVIAQMIPAGANVIPGTVALAGTTGSTIVMSVPVNPTAATISTSTWSGGIATYNTNAQVYTDGNVVTVAGSSRAGYNVTGTILSHTGSSFTMAIADPGGSGAGGTVTGGGNVAINGEYDVGNVGGLRGQVRGDVIDHFATCTGYRLPRWAVIQFAPVDTYASTKGIVAAMTELIL